MQTINRHFEYAKMINTKIDIKYIFKKTLNFIIFVSSLLHPTSENELCKIYYPKTTTIVDYYEKDHSAQWTNAFQQSLNLFCGVPKNFQSYFKLYGGCSALKCRVYMKNKSLFVCFILYNDSVCIG